MTLLGMVDRLTAAGVRFVVIGGLAGRAHGSARITEDLDICYGSCPGQREATRRPPRGVARVDRVPGVGEYADVSRGSVEVTSGGTRFRALGLPALIEAKKATGRAKDQDQLPELEALLALQRRRAQGRP